MTLRVVVLTAFFRPIMGGVESNAERLARYFGAAGLGVTVLTKRITPDLPDEELLDAATGVTVRRIGPSGGRSPGAKWYMVPAVISWLTQHRDAYDVVCAIDCRGVGLGALAARLVTGHPVVAQPQTTGVLVPESGAGIYRQGAKRIAAQLYAQSDAIACIARVIEREALAAGVSRGRVHFLPNAIDMTRFRPPSASERAALRVRHGIADGQVVCAFVGRLSREKGVMELMEAWAQINPHGRAVLLIAGPDMDGHTWNVGPAARDFVTARGLGDSVRFLGPTNDVPSIMQAADVAAQPSHFEALGLSAIEALACGAPVIASGVGGLLDFVHDDENGLLCRPRDPADLARCLDALITDRDHRERLAARARSSVEAEYDERAVFGRFTNLVRTLAERRP
jgi:glycosyltransferase involved in cell wall biosynthesis